MLLRLLVFVRFRVVRVVSVVSVVKVIKIIRGYQGGKSLRVCVLPELLGLF